MEAVGAYIRAMAEQRKMTIAAVSREANVAPNYIWRLEHGDTESPSFEVVAALVAAVRGSMEDVRRLLSEGADAVRAEALALTRVMGAGLNDEQRAYLETLTLDELEALMAVARRMRR